MNHATLLTVPRFPWTMRIIGFILLATLTVTNLTLSRRLPPKDASGPFINLQAFTNPAYTFYCAAGFVTFLGLYTVSSNTSSAAIPRCLPSNRS